MDKTLEDKLRAIALDVQNGRGVEVALNDLAFLPEPVLALLGSALQRAHEKKESAREAMKKRVDAALQGMQDALAELEVIEGMLAEEGGA